MAHQPLSKLSDDIAAAGKLVEVGAQYGHYKHPQWPYTVTGFTILEATDEVAVLYQAQEPGSPQVLFARALSSWLETVEHEGKTIPRFSKITAA